MNTLTPTYLMINYPATVPAKRTSPISLTSKEIEMLHAHQKIWRDYEEAHISQGFWSTLNRFLKLKSVTQHALQAQQRLDAIKQQLEHLSDEHTLSRNDDARLLSRLALCNIQQPMDWI